MLIRRLKQLKMDILAYQLHKYSAAWQHKMHDSQLQQLGEKEELWDIDWTTTIKLRQAAQSTQAHDMDKKHAHGFVACRYNRDTDGNIQKHDHIILTEHYHDTLANHCMLDKLLREAQTRGIQKLTVWSDNGSNLHCADLLAWLADRTNTAYKIQYEHNYYAPGEGKSNCDRLAGRVYTHKRMYLRAGNELNGNIESMLEAIKTMSNVTIGRDMCLCVRRCVCTCQCVHVIIFVCVCTLNRGDGYPGVCVCARC